MLSLVLIAGLGQAVAGTSVDKPVSSAVLREQAARCRSILKRSIVDFYLPANVDIERGGYYEFSRDRAFVPGGEKFLVMQSRQLWFFSKLAAEGIEREASLPAARWGFAFLQKMHDPVNGGYVAKVTDEGAPTDSRKHLYLNSFALYALVAYHHVSNNNEALEAAKALFKVLDAKAHDATNGGYHEFFTNDWKPITDPSEPGFVGAIGVKTYNTHLHLLESFTDLYRAWPDPTLRSRLTELLGIVTSTVRLPWVGCNVDAWHPDWRVVDSSTNLRASYGHDVECAWLALDAAEALGIALPTLRSWADALCDYSLKYGYDAKNGGFFYAGPLGKPADDTKKEWWVQAEAIVGTLTLYRETGRKEYYRAFAGTLDFVEKHQIRKEGGWYAARKSDGSPLNDTISSPWQCAYHNGRALILAAKRLDAMASAASQ